MSSRFVQSEGPWEMYRSCALRKVSQHSWPEMIHCKINWPRGFGTDIVIINCPDMSVINCREWFGIRRCDFFSALIGFILPLHAIVKRCLQRMNFSHFNICLSSLNNYPVFRCHANCSCFAWVSWVAHWVVHKVHDRFDCDAALGNWAWVTVLGKRLQKLHPSRRLGHLPACFWTFLNFRKMPGVQPKRDGSYLSRAQPCSIAWHCQRFFVLRCSRPGVGYAKGRVVQSHSTASQQSGAQHSRRSLSVIQIHGIHATFPRWHFEHFEASFWLFPHLTWKSIRMSWKGPL